MTTALMEKPAPAVTSDQLDLITRTVAVGATPDELKLYLFDCARQGVHPLDKLVHFTKRKGKYTPITSIDFMRIRAAETGEYAGSEDASFISTCENDPRDSRLQSATVTVWRLVQGQRCPFTATARWAEYYPGDGDGSFMWRKMPHTMLAKCAEALALRKGFPRQLAGLYAREELDQAGPDGGYTVSAPPDRVAEVGDARATGRPVEATQIGAVRAGSNPAPVTTDALTIARVDHKPTKNPNVTKFVVVLSDGREVTTIKTQLGSLAEQLCQDGDAVEVETKDTRWGVDLMSLRRSTVEYDEDAGYENAPPLTDDDIPF